MTMSEAEAKAKQDYKEKMAEYEKERIEKLDEATKLAVSDLDHFNQFLSVQSRFDRYSLNNNLMIFAQRPDATRVKDMASWNKEEGRIKKGSKCIYIYEPKKTTKGEKTYTNFVRKQVFDISDVVNVQAEPAKTYDMAQLLEALVANKTVELVSLDDYPKEEKEGMFYEEKDKCIYAKHGMEKEEIFAQLARCLCHAEMARGAEQYNPALHDFEARCAANVLCQKYGVPTDAVKVEFVAPEYTTMEPKEVRAKLDKINSCVKTIARSIYKDLNKEEPAPKKAKGGREDER